VPSDAWRPPPTWKTGRDLNVFTKKGPLLRRPDTNHRPGAIAPAGSKPCISSRGAAGRLAEPRSDGGVSGRRGEDHQTRWAWANSICIAIKPSKPLAYRKIAATHFSLPNPVGVELRGPSCCWLSMFLNSGCVGSCAPQSHSADWQTDNAVILRAGWAAGGMNLFENKFAGVPQRSGAGWSTTQP
jgi:hypothetical protein